MRPSQRRLVEAVTELDAAGGSARGRPHEPEGAVVKALVDVVSGRDPVFLSPLEPGVAATLRS